MKKPKFKTRDANPAEYNTDWWNNLINEIAGGYAFKIYHDDMILKPGTYVDIKHSGGCGDVHRQKLKLTGIKCPSCKNASYDPSMGDGRTMLLEVTY